VPDIKVPKITIPTVDIPSVPFVTEFVLTGVQPACDLVDRDLKITQNPTIVFYNRKQYATCPQGPITATAPVEEDKATAPKAERQRIRSIVYDPQDTIETESSSKYSSGIQLKGAFMPLRKEEKAEEFYPLCPPKNAPYRKGDWRNELRLERLLKYERGLLDGSCNAVWEEVPWVDQFIPSASVTVSTALIAGVAATVPLLLAVVKPLTKQVVKRVANLFKGKKNKVR